MVDLPEKKVVPAEVEDLSNPFLRALMSMAKKAKEKEAQEEEEKK